MMSVRSEVKEHLWALRKRLEDLDAELQSGTGQRR
jgi:hypothetical protein